LRAPARGEEILHKTTLFEARSGGYWNYRVPGILTTPRGVILATVEARRGRGGDWDGNDILLRRSPDGGRSWQPPRVVVRCDDYGPGPVSNFVLIADESDQGVHALYCHNYARVFYTRSDDDGASFADPVEITEAFLPFRTTYPWRVIAASVSGSIAKSRTAAIRKARSSRSGSSIKACSVTMRMRRAAISP
jgi:sialidase-1